MGLPFRLGCCRAAQACPAVLSIIGWHAGETVEDIVERKCGDVAKVGSTLWVYQSWKARLVDVQNFGKLRASPPVYFLEGSAHPAGTEHTASEMSVDGKHWKVLPSGLGKVTGKLPGGALVMANLKAVQDHEIDLWDYVEHPALTPLKFQQGASTVCAIAAPGGQAVGMKSHRRKVVAMGRLTPPFAVFLKE
jgi:hypothetical protein